MSRFVRGRRPVCESKQGGENPNKKLSKGSLKNELGDSACKKTHGLISLDRWCEYFGQDCF